MPSFKMPSFKMPSFKIPKNDAKYHWTNHVIRKMMHYGLSPSRVLRIIRSPKRVEKGIVPETIAVMQEAGNKNKPTEIWAMYAQKSQKSKNLSRVSRGIKSQNSRKKIIITAWRYPGISPVRDQIPIPADILEELKELRAEGF